MSHTVREATILDMLFIAELGYDYVKEVDNHDKFGIDLDYAMINLAKSVIDDKGIVYLAFNGNKLVGILWGTISNLPWSTTPLATDCLFYVDKAHRGSTIGYRLIKAYIASATKKGAVAANISIGSNITHDRTVKLYEKLGFSFIGQQHRRYL